MRSRFAAQAGQLELNVMMPLIAYDLIHSIEILGNTIAALTDSCIVGITANGKVAVKATLKVVLP